LARKEGMPALPVRRFALAGRQARQGNPGPGKENPVK